MTAPYLYPTTSGRHGLGLNPTDVRSYDFNIAMAKSRTWP